MQQSPHTNHSRRSPPLPSATTSYRPIHSTTQVARISLSATVDGYQNEGYLPTRLRQPPVKKEKDAGAGKSSWFKRTLGRLRSLGTFGVKSDPNVPPAPTPAPHPATAVPVSSRPSRPDQVPLQIPDLEQEAEERAVPPTPRNSLASFSLSRTSAETPRPENEDFAVASDRSKALRVLEGDVARRVVEHWEADIERVLGAGAVARFGR
ncbi:hypothetical protein HYFRA_00010980 [Hymenoscyphus fraxineus]|uniref:Uncharacterized protein n=1 Tax=Hymenoscyphus fraxineus TaxID=746836 RepID=A0A9N9PJE6_9HELO|nr:hypothetical protein HYFRA_00010980 [Hymenoscyphus fraxineus]